MIATTVGRRRKFGAVKLGVATAAAVGLTLAGTAPVYAADYQLGPEDVIGFENGDEDSAGYNYDQWHIGSVYSTGADVEDSLTFNECSVTTLAVPDDSAGATVTQVLKGFAIDERPTVGPGGTTESWETLIRSIEIDVAEGDVTLQLPFFVYHDGDITDEPDFFNTIRNADALGPGTHSFDDGTEIVSSADSGEGTMADLIAEIAGLIAEGGAVQLLGVGFTGSEGAEVNSISFGGDTFSFGTGDCLDEAEEDEVDDVDGEAEVIAPTVPERVDTGR